MVKAKFTPSEVERAIRELARILKVKKIKISRLILYGSYARGKQRNFSDIDLAIISPTFRGKNRFIIQEMIARAINGRKGIMTAIEPIGYSTEEYVQADPTTFLGEIKLTGREITGGI